MRDLLFLLRKCFIIISQNVLTRAVIVSDHHYAITVAKQKHKYLSIVISIEIKKNKKMLAIKYIFNLFYLWVSSLSFGK